MEKFIIPRAFQQRRRQYENTLLHTHITSSDVMLILPYTFLRLIYLKKNALCDTTYTTHMKTPTCFGTQVPSSESYYNKDVVRTCVFFFVVVGSIKTLFVKIYKMYKIDIVSNLQCFVNTLI